VVVLGAGEAAEGVLRSLHELGASRVTLLNRRPARAKGLAEAWGAMSGPWEDLAQKLESADLLLVATAGSRPVVSAAQLSRAAATRSDREILVMDLSVPRNVDPAARAVPGVQLFDLDDLQRLCCPAAGAASAALDDAHQVIDDELVRLGLSLRGQVVAGKLTELHRLGVELAEQESARALARLAVTQADWHGWTLRGAGRLAAARAIVAERNLPPVEALNRQCDGSEYAAEPTAPEENLALPEENGAAAPLTANAAR